MGNVDTKTISQEQALDWLAQAFNEPREKITPETRREEIASTKDEPSATATK